MLEPASEHKEKVQRYTGMWIYNAISGKKRIQSEEFSFLNMNKFLPLSRFPP